MCSQVQWNHEPPNQSLNCGTLGKRRRLWVYLLYIRYLLIATCNHHKFDLIMQVHRNMCTPVYTCMIHVCLLHTSCVCYPHVMMYILFSVRKSIKSKLLSWWIYLHTFLAGLNKSLNHQSLWTFWGTATTGFSSYCNLGGAFLQLPQLPKPNSAGWNLLIIYLWFCKGSGFQTF